MTQKFVLEPNELATPEGLSAACERARKFVEENIPGEHVPGSRAYYHFSVRGESRRTGCRCALGFLRTAVAGTLDDRIVEGSYSAICQLIADRPNQAHPVEQFERGFDSGFGNFRDADIRATAYGEAGYRLGVKWRQEKKP